MLFISCLAVTMNAGAQGDSLNALFSTTGANVVGSGKVMVSGAADWHH